MTFHLVTLFPNLFKAYLKEGVIKRAININSQPRRSDRRLLQLGKSKTPLLVGKIKIKFYNPRDFTTNKWRRVDQPPYGGGPGLVIEALPVIRAATEALKAKIKNKKAKVKIIWLTPSGKQFTNELARSWVRQKYTDFVFICGRYEGIDARAKKVLGDITKRKVEMLSIGPFVLTGGELPAMVVMDAVARQVPGVLGNFDSLEERRIASREVYTRPAVFEYRGKKYRVPKILLTGHHQKIAEWRQARKSSV
jgi:tRNA (guanine37-N1)-methyltransferase